MTANPTKAAQLASVRRLYLMAPDGITDIELAARLGVDRATAYRYRQELGATSAHGSRYTLVPSSEDIADALAVLRRAGVAVRTEEA